MMTTIKSFFADESGATAIEYGLIAALLAVVCIGALSYLGTSLSAMFSAVGGEITGATP